jgi:hypothetical protein
MGKTRTFATTEQAVRAFVRHGKQLGYVVVLGGGWWEVPSVAFPRRAQGFSDLEKLLLRRGVLRVLTNGGATFTDPVPAAAQVQS